jgi:ORF6N domain-containing protein
MLDSDLAALYGVDVKALNQAVKRNRSRFPPDFMFQMNSREAAFLRSQFVTTNNGRGGRRTAPYLFTEQGIAMLSSVLRSSRAIRVNIQIMRAFVALRRALIAHQDLARKLEGLERKYDGQFTTVFEAIRQLALPPDPPRRRIGYSESRSSQNTRIDDTVSRQSPRRLLTSRPISRERPRKSRS